MCQSAAPPTEGVCRSTTTTITITRCNNLSWQLRVTSHVVGYRVGRGLGSHRTSNLKSYSSTMPGTSIPVSVVYVWITRITTYAYTLSISQELSFGRELEGSNRAYSRHAGLIQRETYPTEELRGKYVRWRSTAVALARHSRPRQT